MMEDITRMDVVSTIATTILCVIAIAISITSNKGHK